MFSVLPLLLPLRQWMDVWWAVVRCWVWKEMVWKPDSGEDDCWRFEELAAIGLMGGILG